MVKETHWENCYGKMWGDLVAPGCSTHPAKYSRALIYKIVDHMVAQGYVKPGDIVLDPFGGIALGAIPLIQRGINWSGMELEEHFVALGNANIEKWNREFGVHCARWGRASLVQGDSRYLLPLLGRARAVMASPPYAQSLHQRGHGIDKAKFARERDRGRDAPTLDAIGAGYGAVLGSPPYADRIGGDDPKKRGGIFNDPDRANDAQMTARYGDADGQLGAMKDDGFDASMGSPPYGGSDMRGGDTEMTREKNTPSAGYGKSKGQLGGKDGATFWSASRLIVESCYDVLRPGGVAVWVVKNYCRAMEIVPFCQRWLDLQLACGFQHVETIVAHQTDNPGVVQRGLFGNDESKEKRRAGLFRILYESKGGPVVDSEMVYILKKPLDTMGHS